MNVCLFTGRLTRNPELTYTNNGKAVVDFAIAINEGKDHNGEDRVTFVNCQAWDKTAESIAQYFKKGKPITVQSRLRNERWTDTEGQNRRAERFVVDRFNFVPTDSKQEDDGEDAPAPTPKRTNTRKPKQTVPSNKGEAEGFDPTGGEDDVPF